MRYFPNLYNARVKYYPDEEGNFYPDNIIVFSRPIFNPEGWEADKVKSDLLDTTITDKDVQTPSNSLQRSFSRAKSNAFDLLRCNPDCNLFLTLTFSSEQIDRYSYSDIIKKLSQWLDNRVRRHGLKYVLIPEYHKDKAIHFHGIANRSGLRLSDSGLVRFQKKNYPKHLHPRSPIIYNIDDFPYGFTTAIQAVGDNHTEKIAKYIFKYMTKSNGEKIGGRYFLHGGDLSKPKYEYFNIGTNEIDKPFYDLAEGVSFCRISADEHLTFSILLRKAGLTREK